MRHIRCRRGLTERLTFLIAKAGQERRNLRRQGIRRERFDHEEKHIRLRAKRQRLDGHGGIVKRGLVTSQARPWLISCHASWVALALPPEPARDPLSMAPAS